MNEGVPGGGIPQLEKQTVLHALRILRREPDATTGAEERVARSSERTEHQRDAHLSRPDDRYSRDPQIQEALQLRDPLRRAVGR